jgi:type I restriction enzyme S subunit
MKDGMGVPHLFQADLRKFMVLLPPESEQRAIATYLDRETEKIDALIEKKQRQMVVLEEKRAALINRAVTKGLDPNVPMQDSGILWLARVPAHWILLRLGRLATEKCDGPFGSGLKSEHYTDEGVRVVRLQNIGPGYFEGTDRAYIDRAYFEAELTRHSVSAGDVLLAGLGDDNHLPGRACVAPEGIEPAMVKADCFRFRLNRDRCLPEFVALQLNAGAAHDSGVLTVGATRARIPLTVMSCRTIALPPPEEQMAIVRSLHAITVNTDAAITKIRGQIAKLQEYRTALISAAVTGKIDVREGTNA